MTSKRQEGQEKIKSAEKSLKTSLLKWRPDYEIAASEYSSAATCFKNARDFELSKDCLIKAAECHKQSRSFFHAAKCMDQVVLLAKDLNNYSDVLEYAEKACNLYQQHGSPESGAAALDRAAKIIEHQSPEQAAYLYQKAADVVMIEDSTRQAAEFMSKVARLLVKLKLYDRAADAIRREIGLHQQSENIQSIGRLAVALVLIQLARGDCVAAEKAFKEWGNCCDAPEVQNLEMLLQGFDEEDSESVQQALSHPFIRHMDVEYAKLARDLPLPQGITTSRPAAPNKSNPPAYTIANDEAAGMMDDEGTRRRGEPEVDDEDEGLC